MSSNLMNYISNFSLFNKLSKNTQKVNKCVISFKNMCYNAKMPQIFKIYGVTLSGLKFLKRKRISLYI